jgi:hypothetical protein
LSGGFSVALVAVALLTDIVVSLPFAVVPA